MSFNLDPNYVDVAERIRLFRDKHPDGSLQSQIEMAPDRTWVMCKAWAYRDQQDQVPGIGHSLLTIPGKTPYTRDSEVENAETSAWGRAIVAVLAADTKKIASADEVAARHEPGRGSPPVPAAKSASAVEAPPSPPPADADTSQQADEIRSAFAPPLAAQSTAVGFKWKYGPHAGLTLTETPLDYVIEYSESGKVDWLREKCKTYLEENGYMVGAGSDPDEGIPFAPTIDGWGY